MEGSDESKGMDGTEVIEHVGGRCLASALTAADC